MKKDERELPEHGQKILKLLARAQKPLSAYQILSHLREKGIHSPPTVYRALEKLIEAGHVHRIETLGAFVACNAEHNHKKCSDHVFYICTACGCVRECCDSKLSSRITQSENDGFLSTILKKVVEVSGLCVACQRSRGRA